MLQNRQLHVNGQLTEIELHYRVHKGENPKYIYYILIRKLVDQVSSCARRGENRVGGFLETIFLLFATWLSAS